MRLKSRCCLLLAGSKIFLSPLLPVSILIDSLLPSKKRLVCPLLCCISWSSASVFCVFRIAGIRRWFPISMVAPGFGRPIWLVQLSLLEAPAVVRLRTPRPRISHSQSKASFFFFIYLFCIFFLSIGRLRANRCGGDWCSLRYALPVGCSLFCLFHPVPALRQKIFVFDLSSQRNKSV